MSSDINLIIPGLWLGSQSYCYNDLVSRGITRVLIIGTDTIMSCCRGRCAATTNKKFLVLRIHIKDHENENILNCLNDAINFIDNGINEEGAHIPSLGGVLVHCAAGMSRSPAIVIAYLMSKNYGTMEDCFKIVKLQRPTINLNTGFQKQLVLYEKILTFNRKPPKLTYSES